MREYVAEARRVYDLVGGGEADLYRLFLALAVSLAVVACDGDDFGTASCGDAAARGPGDW